MSHDTAGAPGDAAATSAVRKSRCNEPVGCGTVAEPPEIASRVLPPVTTRIGGGPTGVGSGTPTTGLSGAVTTGPTGSGAGRVIGAAGFAGAGRRTSRMGG